MKKKFKLILILGCVLLACLGASACASETEIEKYQKQGYKITVTYNANGGKMLGREGVSIVDLFNPDLYEKDANGEIHIKLLEPTDESRPSNSTIKLEKADYFCVGWYQTREIVTVNGKPVDEDGNELVVQPDGSYLIASTVDSEVPIEATPAYIYSDPWDFENDTIDYSEEKYADTKGNCEITLYAGWVKYFRFDYYYQNAQGEWTAYGSTSFDYQSEAENDAGADTLYIPQWDNGAMNYKPNGVNSFAKLSGTTFSKAYTDADCTQEITESIVHSGTIDYATASAKNSVNNIYVVLDEGERYKIETADQLIKNPNLAGYYEICNDLDFSQKEWPATFSGGAFSGKMYGSEGKTVTIENLNVTYAANVAITGGAVFGTVTQSAVVENLTFKNVTFDLSYAGTRQTDTSFGLFAGVIEDGATVTNVSLIGDLTFKIGAVTLGTGYGFNLLANGNTNGITADLTQIGLQLYGSEMVGSYKFTIDYENVTVDAVNGEISLTFSSKTSSDAVIIIQ